MSNVYGHEFYFSICIDMLDHLKMIVAQSLFDLVYMYVGLKCKKIDQIRPEVMS